MKLLMLLLSCSLTLLADSHNFLSVKEHDATVKLNGEKKLLPKETNMKLHGGDSICFIGGEGRIVINDQKQLTQQNKECYIVPVSKEFDIKSFVSSIKEKVYVAYFNSTETVRHGSSAKGTATNSFSEIVLDKDQDLLISSNRFGPLPVEIKLYNENDLLIETLVNDSEAITFLRLPHKNLHDGYQLKIANGFGQILLTAKLKIQ